MLTPLPLRSFKQTHPFKTAVWGPAGRQTFTLRPDAVHAEAPHARRSPEVEPETEQTSEESPRVVSRPRQVQRARGRLPSLRSGKMCRCSCLLKTDRSSPAHTGAFRMAVLESDHPPTGSFYTFAIISNATFAHKNLRTLLNVFLYIIFVEGETARSQSLGI